MKGKLLVLVALGVAIFGIAAWAELDEESSCTAIIVGKEASVDGSVMTTHTCDGWYDSRLFIIPGGKHEPGETVKIWKNRLHADRPNVTPEVVGEIPQVEVTYTYFHVAYPCMNEHQVAIGESTFGGRKELVNPRGMFYIEELEAIALQRAKTAREAIQIMGKLAEEYGYADWGECLTVVDPNEGWVFEIVGPGPFWEPGCGKPGAVWVARRVPDDEVFVSANRARIGKIDLSKPDWYMASPNVFDLAIELGYWDPDSGKPFKFYEAYAPEDYFYCSRREWRVFDILAPSKKFDPWARRYPFSVKPDKKVSVADLMAINRDYYEGTEFDLTKGLAAGPYGTPVRYNTPRPYPVSSGWERPISKFRCSYSWVSQSRSWLPDPIGGVLWFGLDAPHGTCYMPLYCGITEVPESLQIMNRFEFSRESAWWAFDFVENWANLAFCYVIEDIREMQRKFEGEFLAVQAAVENAALMLYEQDPELAITFLTDYSNSAVNRVVDAWWDFADMLIAKYNDGYIWQKTKGYPEWWLKAVGYGETTRVELYKDIYYEDEDP